LTFWNWRRGTTATATAASAALTFAPELAPIELYTAQARIVGWIEANGRRVTDLLNDQDELRLWRPSPGPLDGALNEAAAGVTEDVPDPDEVDRAAGEWQSLPTDQVVLAMPPEWRASRQLRLHRRLRRAAITAGPFNVTGNLHLSPGVEIGPQILLRSPRWLPLTDAYLLHTGEPPFEHVVSVVVVNTAHIAQLMPLVTLA
jgi:hypothetical protein